MELKSAGWGCRVDALSKRYERYAQRMKLIQQQNQMSKIPPEPVEPPHNEHVEFPTLGRFQHLIEGRTPLLRARDTLVDELGRSPASALAVGTQLSALT